jgi:hypothetical protein
LGIFVQLIGFVVLDPEADSSGSAIAAVQYQYDVICFFSNFLSTAIALWEIEIFDSFLKDGKSEFFFCWEISLFPAIVPGCT